jgi:type I restriction enzyme S subunit
MSDIQISVPPREVQEEIGEALHNLELLTTSMDEGLPAEITARRQQYEYYRNKLLTFRELDVA